MAGERDEHSTVLAELGIPAEPRAALARYLDLVASWNQRTNLTGAVSAEQRVRVLVADPWLASGHVKSGSVLDVGSGNGSPGLVLALLRPDLAMTLLEPRARRWAFLREAARELGRPDVMVERCRSDAYGGRPVQTITVRAVRLDLADLGRLLAPSGEILIFGGQPEARPPFSLQARHRLNDSELHVFARDVSRET